MAKRTTNLEYRKGTFYYRVSFSLNRKTFSLRLSLGTADPVTARENVALIADAELYLLRGRVRFLDASGKGQHTPFSLMLVTLGATGAQEARYAELVPGFWLSRS